MKEEHEKTDLIAREPDNTAFSIEFGDILRSGSNFFSDQKPTKIKDELARREKLRNDDLDQDIKLKKLTLKVLLGFLGAETLVIFVFAFFQATMMWGFMLEEWSFRLLLAATITQIYFMLRVAVEYLFPNHK